MTFGKEARIAVLEGGWSGEREVSLRSGKGMARALRDRGYAKVAEIDAGYDLAEDLKRERIEVAVIALHGRFGEDGTVQGILEFLRIPYTGSGVTASAAAIDKVISKRLFQACGVPTPGWTTTYAGQPLKEVVDQVASVVGLPAVAKPPCEGSTLGLTVVRSEKEIEGAVSTALGYGDTILWEEFIDGHELAVGFLSDKPLPIVEIVPHSGLYDYRSKYTAGATDYFCPARLSGETAGKTVRAAVDAYCAVQAESFGRVDVICARDGSPYVLEVNTIPGMTETSLIPKAAAAAGISFEGLVETLLQEARLKTARTG